MAPTEPIPSGDNRATETNRWARSTEVLALVVALAFLFGLAATRLGSTGLWADEAWSLAAANDLGLSVRSTHGTMAAYYSLLWVWARAGTSTVWLRLLSTLFAAGTVVVTQAIGRHVGGRRLAVLAPLLLVTSPMFVWTGTEARGYALETLLTAISWYAAIRIIQRNTDDATRRRWAVVLVVTAFLGPLAHGLFIAQLIAIGCWAFIPPNRVRRVRRFVPALVVGLVTTFLLFDAGLRDVGAVVDASANQLFANLRGWYLSPWAVIGWITFAVAAVALVAAARQLRRSVRMGTDTTELVPAVWTVVPLCVLIVVRMFHSVWAPYYTSPLAPGIALLVGAGAIVILDYVTERFAVGRSQRVWGALVPLALVLALASATVARPLEAVQGWRTSARIVAIQARPGDAIIFGSGEPETPVAARPGFEAAWRETRHTVVPVSLFPTRPLGKVRRVDRYPSPQELARSSSRFHRIWAVDYLNELEQRDITTRPPFDTSFREVQNHTLAGDVVVRLYVRDR